MGDKVVDLNCGLIMPVSGSEVYPDSHWLDVRKILEAAVKDAGFKPSLVSEGDSVTVIHKRIAPIVICDVSGKNPNVMFELGLRLAFDKPTIIVKDEITDYSFDTSPIEHLGYQRDLRFGSIVDFKNKLTEKIKATFQEASSDPNFSTFLKHFGEFKVPKIEQKEVNSNILILDELKALRSAVEHLLRISRGLSIKPGLNSFIGFNIDGDAPSPERNQLPSGLLEILLNRSGKD
jgi:hypothetical protein